LGALISIEDAGLAEPGEGRAQRRHVGTALAEMS
jgi:hypothetical protein